MRETRVDRPPELEPDDNGQEFPQPGPDAELVAEDWDEGRAPRSPRRAPQATAARVSVDEFIALARAQVGDRYVLGVEVSASNPDPSVFDCSELVEWLFARAGCPIVDLAASQYDATAPFAGTPRTGDLVFLANNPARWNRIGHVALIAAPLANGDWSIVEAKGRAYGVVETTWSFWKTRAHYAGARRFPGLTLGAPTGTTRAAPLQGIDISRWQPDIDLSRVSVDFVISRATRGTPDLSVDTSWAGHIAQTLALGKLAGAYHFASGEPGRAEAEATYFSDVVRPYLGMGLRPVLDWEPPNASQTSWAAAFVDEFERRTGVRPWIYLNASTANSYDWSAIRDHTPLWLAHYPVPIASGFAPAGSRRNTPGWQVVAWQFSSKGRIAGYSGDLDLNFYYGSREDWAGGGATTAFGYSVGPKTSLLEVDGEFGPLTVKALQRWLGGLVVDGEFGPRTTRALQRRLGVTADGDFGPISTRALQRLVGAEVDGEWGPRTTTALQRFLNSLLAPPV